jgi:transglutaminase-like putative cysteine protease
VRRTLVASALPAAVTVFLWLRFEQPREQAWRAVALAAAALMVAALRLRRLRLAALVGGAGLAVWLAFGLSPVRPHTPGTVVSRFGNGFLDFYEVHLPYDPRLHADMHTVVLVAVFAFTLAVALAAAARRPVLATLAFLVGAGWPATLLGPSHAVLAGTAILVAALALLAGLTARRLLPAAVPAVGAVALAAAMLGSSAALARHQLVAWQTWQPGTAQPAVGVSFVWNAQYAGLRFPARRTTVLEVAAPISASLYWRAGVLDDFVRDAWSAGLLRPADSLEPAAAYLPANQVEQAVTVEGLADTRLVGGSTPIRFDGGDAPLTTPQPGFADLLSGLTSGYRYRVWSYAPQPTAAQLARSPARYPRVLADDGLLRHPRPAAYEPLRRTAVAVTRNAHTPYGKVVALERWFRESGRFRYDARPPVGTPPLVAFVTTTHAGYCQYFAGAMALMLRYLGIPARVAVGFSSGTYSSAKRAWIVSDHDAHAWVEAWFPGYGWLPFDPTPSAGRPERGVLSAAYSASSPLHGRTRVARRAVPTSPGPPFGGRALGLEGTGSQLGRKAGRSHGSTATRTALLALVLLIGALVGAVPVAKRSRELARRRTRDPRRAAAAVRAELAGFLLDQGFDAAAHGTLRELGALVQREFGVDAGRFVATASAARFAAPAEAARALPDARRELGELLRLLRRGLSRRRRLRGVVSPRSLRMLDVSASLVGEGSR